MAELFQKRVHPPRMRAHFDHHMGRWASKEEGPKRFANRLDGFRSFDSAVRPKNAQSALLVSQIASNHRSGTFRHGRSLLAPSSALKPADYLLGLKERPPHPISVGRAACGAQNPHGPRAREPGAAATTRPASPPLEATAIRAPRSSLLAVTLPPVGWVARGAPCRSPPDRDSLAPARVPRHLDLEVTPRTGGSTKCQLRACRTRPYHGTRESALGIATHSRRVAQARLRTIAALRCAADAAPPEVTLANLANVPPEPRRRPRLRRLLRRADGDLPGALRVRGAAASSPTSRALQRHRFPHCHMDCAANRRGVPP